MQKLFDLFILMCYNRLAGDEKMLKVMQGENDFLYFFNLIDFDNSGNVCKTNTCDENKAKSNFLYLISKYNQKLLNENEKVSDFFRTDLQKVLEKVENGESFEKAKEVVVENCKYDVKTLFKCAKSDKDFVKELNQKMVEHETDYTKKFQKAVNNLQLSYIITSISGNIYDEIATLDEIDAKSKSNKYKKVIDYNALSKIAALVADNKLTKNDLCASRAQ